MHLNTAILASTTLGLAQAAIFTNTHFVGLTAGQPFDITFTKADGPVTIELMSGDVYNLQLIQTLATDVSGEHFSWVPTGTLCVDTYSLRITDKSGIPNYSASFPLTEDHKFTARGDCSTGAVLPDAMDTAESIHASVPVNNPDLTTTLAEVVVPDHLDAFDPVVTAAPALAMRDATGPSSSYAASKLVLQTKTVVRDGVQTILTRTTLIPASVAGIRMFPEYCSFIAFSITDQK